MTLPWEFPIGDWPEGLGRAIRHLMLPHPRGEDYALERAIIEAHRAVTDLEELWGEGLDDPEAEAWRRRVLDLTNLDGNKWRHELGDDGFWAARARSMSPTDRFEFAQALWELVARCNRVSSDHDAVLGSIETLRHT